MAFFKTYPLANSAILRLNLEKDRINVNPTYQRRGEVWTLEKRQLLIDSILNDYDIPKLYFHVLKNTSSYTKELSGTSMYDYAVIDGRQRLETIWGFTNDDFRLSTEFVFLPDENVNARGMTYSQLASAYPKLKVRFDSFTLPIICVETDEIDLIEDMFSRLNEAVPLNAAEKRNALGGPMADTIREISSHPFFAKKVSLSNKRYQHREVAARLLFLEYSLHFNRKIIDTKKPYLDDMVKKYRQKKAKDISLIASHTTAILDKLSSCFNDKDSLLKAQATIPIFYLTMKIAMDSCMVRLFTRDKIITFMRKISSNKRKASDNIASAIFELLEYDRMTQQGTNDATSIKERTRILCSFLGLDEYYNLV